MNFFIRHLALAGKTYLKYILFAFVVTDELNRSEKLDVEWRWLSLIYNGGLYCFKGE